MREGECECEDECERERGSEREREREAGTTRNGTETETEGPPAYEATRSEGVLRVRRRPSRTGPDARTEWLSTGWNGGRSSAPSAYNVSVPEGWACEEIGPYVAQRLEAAGFAERGPVLLTGVDLEHARGARCGPVTVYATAGLSNPAALPMDPPGGELTDGRLERDRRADGDGGEDEDDERDGQTPIGTVNVIVGTTLELEAGALANLLTVAAEAKAATLLAETGFPGTTTDAVVVGHDSAGPTATYSGSATTVGAATRACVREAVRASLRSRYETTEATIPDSVASAKYGVSTDVRATVFCPDVRLDDCDRGSDTDSDPAFDREE